MITVAVLSAAATIMASNAWYANNNKNSEGISGTMSGYGFDTTAYVDEDRQAWDLSPVGDWDTYTENTNGGSKGKKGRFLNITPFPFTSFGVVVACLLTLHGCKAQVDDSYEVVSTAIETILEIPRGSISPYSTLEDLGCDAESASDILHTLERYYGITISNQEREMLGGESGWKGMNALSLTDLICQKGVQYSGGKSSYRNASP